MRIWPCLLTATALLLTPAFGEGGSARPARALLVELQPFGNPEVVAAKTSPPQFDLVLTFNAPTPGYEFGIDSVDVDESNIRVRFTEKRPAGMAAQVMTPTRVKIPLGTVETGTYVVELWLRRGNNDHKPVQSLVIRAL